VRASLRITRHERPDEDRDGPSEKRHAIEVLVNHLEDDPAGYWASRTWNLEDRLKGFTALCFEIEDTTAKQGK
jgi:hypothetical protein